MLVQRGPDHLEPEMPATLDTPQGRSSQRHFGTDLNQNFYLIRHLAVAQLCVRATARASATWEAQRSLCQQSRAHLSLITEILRGSARSSRLGISPEMEARCVFAFASRATVHAALNA
jgi:phage baseplate assembly protein W